MSDSVLNTSESALSAEQVDTIDDDARRAKIEAIRQQLAAGSYMISGKDVAGRILDVIKN